jgi:hypothetical protein
VHLHRTRDVADLHQPPTDKIWATHSDT